MLIIFAGLPGVGKSTIAQACARELRAIHVRIDTIEQAIRDCGRQEVGPEGYVVGYGVARDNLLLGHTVIADSVNPLLITRQSWRQAAIDCGCRWVDVEIVCSDLALHRRRAESRVIDVPGLIAPDWPAIVSREYDAWDSEPLRIDTAKHTVEEAVALIRAAI